MRSVYTVAAPRFSYSRSRGLPCFCCVRPCLSRWARRACAGLFPGPGCPLRLVVGVDTGKLEKRLRSTTQMAMHQSYCTSTSTSEGRFSTTDGCTRYSTLVDLMLRLGSNCVPVCAAQDASGEHHMIRMYRASRSKRRQASDSCTIVCVARRHGLP